MSRFQPILAGATINDVATSEAHDVDSGTFNYYGYAKPDGTWVIMREKTDETEYRYAVNNGPSDSFATAWTNRASKTYKRSNEYKLFTYNT